MSKSKPTKCDCTAEYVCGVEYDGIHPQHYDGISEWACEKCHRRWGRWTGKELMGEEFELRYGGPEHER